MPPITKPAGEHPDKPSDEGKDAVKDVAEETKRDPEDAHAAQDKPEPDRP